MSDETYYTVLNVKESASASEIKTAYRDIIKQVHPDTIANLTPYLRKIAEDKAKEIIEAYTVLSNSGKRNDYDRQLAEYRRQTMPPSTPPKQPAPQAASTTSSGPYCNHCGTSLYASGFCPSCNKFSVPFATPSRPASPRPQTKAVRWPGCNWAPRGQFSREHPYIVVFTVLSVVYFITWFGADAITSHSAVDTSQSQSKPVFTDVAAAPSMGPSEYPCDHRDNISPIDGKPCNDHWVPAPLGVTVDEKSTEATLQAPMASASGVYDGTISNQTASLRSAFTVVIHQTKAGLIDGCMEVKAPLYGSGTLRGRVRGAHINFTVDDMTFQGNVSQSAIAGSYVVSRQDGQQLGDFHLARQQVARMLYTCVNGTLVDATKGTSP